MRHIIKYTDSGKENTMNLIKVTQYARNVRLKAAAKFGGKASDYAWRGRDEEGNPVGALDIALDEARQHTSEDEAVIKTIEKYIVKQSQDYTYNTRPVVNTFKNTGNWTQKIISSAIEDLGYHIVANILRESLDKVRVLIKQIIHIIYDPEVNIDFYNEHEDLLDNDKVIEENGTAESATDEFLELMMQENATKIYKNFIQMEGIASIE